MKFLFTSDLHGNLDQYKSLIRLANATHHQRCHIIIGGDLFPKRKASQSRRRRQKQHQQYGHQDKTVASQLRFFEHDLIPLLMQLEPPRHCYLTMGNADFACNLDAYQRIIHNAHMQSGESLKRVHFVVNDCVHLHDGDSEENLSLAFYSGVPLTRHRLKDWERYDTHDIDQLVARSDGYIGFQGETTMDEQLLDRVMGSWNWRVKKKTTSKSSYGRESRRIRLPSSSREGSDVAKRFSIQTELSHVIHDSQCTEQDLHRKWIWVTHGPAYDTIADLCKTGKHVGSVAIRQLAEKHEPLALLSGHIHEAVDMSNGTFLERLGSKKSTWIICSGNYPHQRKLTVVLFDSQHPANSSRILV